MKFYNYLMSFHQRTVLLEVVKLRGGRSFSERSPHTHEFKNTYRIKKNNDPHKFMTGVGGGSICRHVKTTPKKNGNCFVGERPRSRYSAR